MGYLAFYLDFVEASQNWPLYPASDLLLFETRQKIENCDIKSSVKHGGHHIFTLLLIRRALDNDVTCSRALDDKKITLVKYVRLSILLFIKRTSVFLHVIAPES